MIADYSIWAVLLICVGVFVASFVDAIGGGGGLISTPVYLLAGLPMHQGFLNMMDGAENAFISAYRQETIGRKGETQIEIISEYLAAPSIEGKTLILVDPMLATGLSMEVAYKALLSHGTPKSVHLACLFGTPQAIEHLSKTMPQDTTLWCAVIDPMLNEKKYIVPGLGDAGDLCFGEKL